MTAVYLTYVGIAATAAVFFIGGIAALAQLAATQMSPALAARTWRRGWVAVGSGSLLIATAWSVVAAVSGGLPTHPAVLDDPALAMGTGLALVVAVGALSIAIIKAIGLLRPEVAVRELLEHMTARRWAEYVIAPRGPLEISLEDERRAVEGLGLGEVDRLIATSAIPDDVDVDVVGDGDADADSDMEEGRSRALLDRAGVDKYEAYRDRIKVRAHERSSNVKTAQARLRHAKIDDPMKPVFEVAERSLLVGPDLEFERLVDRILDAIMQLETQISSSAFSEEELRRLALTAVFDDHLTRLAGHAVDLGRPDRGATISRAATRRLQTRPAAELPSVVYSLTLTLARRCVDSRAAAPLCSVIGDLADQTIAALAIVRESRGQLTAELLRGLGELGQRIPVEFYRADDPILTMSPNSRRFGRPEPLRALFDATSRILDEMSSVRGLDFAAVWVDAVMVTTNAIGKANGHHSRSDLHSFLYEGVDQIADMGTHAAKIRDERPAQAAALRLGGLAREADTADKDYRHALAMAMAQIAIHAFDRDVRTVGPRQALGGWIARRLAELLPDQLDSTITEIDDRPFDDGSDDANERFVAALRAASVEGRPGK